MNLIVVVGFYLEWKKQKKMKNNQMNIGFDLSKTSLVRWPVSGKIWKIEEHIQGSIQFVVGVDEDVLFHSVFYDVEIREILLEIEFKELRKEYEVMIFDFKEIIGMKKLWFLFQDEDCNRFIFI